MFLSRAGPDDNQVDVKTKTNDSRELGTDDN
jgi:hypothetical protein